MRFARLRHFVFTFHDETFECLADGYAVGGDRGLAEIVRDQTDDATGPESR